MSAFARTAAGFYRAFYRASLQSGEIEVIFR